MKKSLLKKILVSSTLLILIILGTFHLYPTPTINRPNYLQILSNENEKIYETSSSYQGGYVKLNDVSQCFIDTLITIEDKRFYDHNGLDFLRIIKSAFSNIKDGQLNQGASTITQQLARILFLNNEKSFSRKIKEMILALKIEATYSKEKILETYINSVYFAHNLYGLKAACNYYFNKDPSLLNYHESCILVGIINAPNLYSPFIDPQASYQKSKSIAYTLYKNNIINVDTYYQILKENINLYGKTAAYNYSLYYHQGVTRELQKYDLLSKNKNIGLKINTHYDTLTQNLIQNVVSSYTFSNQISVIISKPYTPKIIALIGGKDFNSSEYNRALDSKRQVGSTIKPIIYYLGLKGGLTPLTKFESKPTIFTLKDDTKYEPKNNKEIYAYRKINMVEAIAMSDNIYAVKTALYVGSSSIVSLLNKFNMKIENDNISIALGSIELTPYQLHSIYHTFASEGKYYDLKFIDSVQTQENLILYKCSSSSKKILDEKECIMINHLLKSPLDNSLSTYALPTMHSHHINSTFAVKTGTSDYSAWTIGFNKDYCISVYVGDDENKSKPNGTICKQIFTDIVNQLTNKKEDNFYSYPSSLKQFKIHNSMYNTYSKTYLTVK